MDPDQRPAVHRPSRLRSTRRRVEALLKLKNPIDAHKGSTGIVVLALMAAFDNWTTGPFVYLACHGIYGVMWVLKSYTFPDPAWERKIPTFTGAAVFGGLGAYWLAPVLLVYTRAEPPPWLLCLSVALVVFGTFLHFGSDAQKYYTLKHRQWLITEGFFKYTRNPNYLGELLIYSGFAALSMHWAPWLVLAAAFFGLFLPNMRRKERRMARYPEWEAYKAQSGFFIPKLWGQSSSST